MKDIIIFILIIASVVGLFKYIIWYGRLQAKIANQELKYDIMYENIQCIIYTWVVNEKSYHAIEGFFDQLRELPHKNKEKTNVLHDSFLKIYEPVINQIRSEEEFTPEAVLRK